MKFPLIPLIGLLLLPATLQAGEAPWYAYDHLYLQGGTYVHFESSDDHDGTKMFLSLEAVRSDDWLYGLALSTTRLASFHNIFMAGRVGTSVANSSISTSRSLLD